MEITKIHLLLSKTSTKFTLYILIEWGRKKKQMENNYKPPSTRLHFLLSYSATPLCYYTSKRKREKSAETKKWQFTGISIIIIIVVVVTIIIITPEVLGPEI